MWQGKVIAGTGLVLILAGAIGLYAGYENSSFGGAAAAWGAILAGTLALLGGIGRFMGSFMRPQHTTETEYGPTEVRLLIQCMGAIAAADGRIQTEEMGTIARIHERVLGIHVDEDEIAEILSGFDSSFDIAARLAEAAPRLSPMMRQRIVKSCYLVMMSDLVEDSAEIGKIHEIGAALGFSDQEVDDLVAMAGV